MASFAYTLQILGDGMDPVGMPLPLPPPQLRLLEALRWRNFCAGRRLDPYLVELSPVWHSTRGRPFVERIEAVDVENGARVGVDVTALYSPVAQHVSARLVHQKLLAKGQSYSFQVAAHPSPTIAAHTFEDTFDDYPVTETTENHEPAQSLYHFDAEYAAPDDFDVRIPRSLIAYAVRLAEQAKDTETGGVLFGRLLRQPALSPQPRLEITCLAPVEAGHGARESFQFTPESWTRARALLEERNQDEVFAGWFHSHPDFCDPKCPPEKRAVCPLRKPFFSQDDMILHETIFPAAWGVGLLVADSGEARIPALFGWRDGLILRRAFHIIND